MLRFKRIQVRHFAVFDDLEVEPSTDPNRPLTVIRAENGSGKTTFLRALLWGMYGERGLPGARPERYSVHPAWWQPNSTGIETKVAIEFETDGSDRHEPDAGVETSTYLLSRTVLTVERTASRHDEPDFERRDHTTSLTRRKDSGAWEPVDAGVDAVIEFLLPWSLRDFFVMDTDQATDFVGGTENREISVGEVERKTTRAVRSLLGIEVFEAAASRLRGAERRFGREATKAIRNNSLDQLQAELDRLDGRVAAIRSELEAKQDDTRDLKGRLDSTRQRQTEELRRQGSHEALVKLRAGAERRRNLARTSRREATAGLSALLASPALLAPLATSALDGVARSLQPLHDAGVIPLKHIGFVRRLLDQGECVCGQDLKASSRRRRRLEEEIRRSMEREMEADYLGHLYEAARLLLPESTTVAWPDSVKRLGGDIRHADEEIADASLELRDVEMKLDKIDIHQIQNLRDEEATLASRLDRAQQDVGSLEQELKTIQSSREGIRGKLGAAQRRDAAAAESSAAQDLAALAAGVLEGAVSTLRISQVNDLSERMNRLFRQMTANLTDADFEGAEEGRQSVRMIDRVGVRPVEDRQDRFEIFALNNRLRSMPPTEINGASRRVLALAFVLALCEESRTHAPLVADSLLNSMSGAVRRNTLEMTVEKSEQPILLLTGADLEADAEVEIVRRSAGAVYTLTGQWDAANGDQQGDVLHQTSARRNVAVLCPCGPREFCNVCERQGQRATPGWSSRN